MAKITIDGVTGEYPDGMTYEEIADAYQDRYENTIALVLEDGKIRELIKTVHKDCTLSFLTLKDSIGQGICKNGSHGTASGGSRCDPGSKYQSGICHWPRLLL